MGAWVFRVLQKGGFESRAFPGTLDHGKFWTTVLLVSVIVAQFVYNPFPVLMVTVLGSLAYGKAAWSRFLESKTVTGTANFDSSFVKNVSQSTSRIVIEKVEHALDPDGVFSQPTND